MPSPPELTARQRQRIVRRTYECIDLANQALDLHLAHIPVRFDVYGTAWGYYQRRAGQCVIRYNPWLFARHFEAGLADTVPHEVAHYVVDHAWSRRVKPHGLEWQTIMALFGVANPRATHRDDLSDLPVRRQRRFRYFCRCGDVLLSATRHNRHMRGEASYHCRRCGWPLVWSGKEA